MSRVTLEMARAAAEWWGDKLAGKKSGWDLFRQAGYFDHGGQDALNGALGGGLVDMILAKSPTPAPETIAKFVDNLTAGILARADDGVFFGAMCVSTDYHPDMTLRDAAEGLGIENLDLRLPWKTRLFVAEEYIDANGDLLWQTKRDALRRLVEAKLRAWEEEDRAPPRWQVFGDSGTGKWDRTTEGLGRAQEQLYWADERIVRRRAKKAIAAIPEEHFSGDVENVAVAIVADAVKNSCSSLGIAPGATYFSDGTSRTIRSIGNVTREEFEKRPSWRGFYGECVVSFSTENPDSVSDTWCVEIVPFVDWLVASGTKLEAPVPAAAVPSVEAELEAP